MHHHLSWPAQPACDDRESPTFEPVLTHGQPRSPSQSSRPKSPRDSTVGREPNDPVDFLAQLGSQSDPGHQKLPWHNPSDRKSSAQNSDEPQFHRFYDVNEPEPIVQARIDETSTQLAGNLRQDGHEFNGKWDQLEQ